MLSSSRGKRRSRADPGTQRRAERDLFRHGRHGALRLRCAAAPLGPPVSATPRRRMTTAGMRGVCQKSSYRRCPNPSPINPLAFSSANLPASSPAAPIIPRSRRPGGSLGRRSAAAAGADGAGATRSRIPKGSLAEGMRSRAGWKAGRPRGRGGDPHRSRRWSLPSLPAVCRRTPRQQRGPRSGHVETRPRGASDVRRNTNPYGLRADARRSAHAPSPSPNRRAGFQPALSRAGHSSGHRRSSNRRSS